MFSAECNNKETKILGVITKIKNSGLLLDKNNFLFGHNTVKDLDSCIMDYIHGSSSLFVGVQTIMGETVVKPVVSVTTLMILLNTSFYYV